MSASIPNPGSLIKPGAALKAYRTERGMTLADLSQKTGLQPSTLSKIENGKIGTTIDKLLRISLALGVNVADVFASPAQSLATGPASRIRSITRAGEGEMVHSANGEFRYQAYDLLNKGLTPIVADIHARSLDEFGSLHRHAGEELVYVIEGELALYTDTYTPTYLKAGDTVYFDSGMGHAYVAVGDKPCRILSVFLTPQNEAVDLMEAMPGTGPTAVPAKGKTRTRSKSPKTGAK